ncbi:MAG: AAA family ATPase, partial [Actinomycetes bacterium]
MLARAEAERFTDDNPGAVVEWAVGTATSSVVPLGALRHLMGPADLDKSVSRTSVLRQARELLRLRGRDRVLVVVDDAHYLDPLSATLLYQLAATASARLVVTVGADRPVPEQVAALSRDGLLDRLDLESPQPARAAELRARSEDELAALPDNIRTALDYLAVYQPLLLADLATLTGDQLDPDAARNALRVIEADWGSFVYCAHPLVAEAARGMLDDTSARRLRTALVTRWSGRSPDSVIDQLQLAVLALESDRPRPVDELVAAAGHALALGDMVLAEKLAAAAPQPAGGLPARLILANALAWQGRGREADAILSAVDPAELSETDLMAWALPRAANQFFMLGDPAKATAFLQTTRDRITVPAARATLDALAATFALNSGTPLRALRIADEVLASPHADQAATGWAASAAALSCARTG